MSDKKKRLIIRTTILLILAAALGFTLFQIFHTKKTLTTGDQAPDFVLTDIHGKKVQLSDFKGKGVMINFWASWCDPCKKEMPFIEKAYEQTKNKNIVILEVDIGESTFAVKSFLDINAFKFNVLLDKNRDVTDTYDIGPIPTTFFIDKNGKIVNKVVGSMPNEQYILGQLSRIQP